LSIEYYVHFDSMLSASPTGHLIYKFINIYRYLVHLDKLGAPPNGTDAVRCQISVKLDDKVL